MGRRRRKIPAEPFKINISSLSHEGRGITRIDNKTTFVDGALPGEEVLFKYQRRKSSYDEGKVLEVLKPSPDRVQPQCEYFGVCGGCSLQHMPADLQLKHKQQVLLEQFQHIGGVEPIEFLPPLTGPVSGYRRKARLAVKYVEKKQKVLIGFREKYSPYVADIDRCYVLHPRVGESIGKLQQMVSALSVYRQIPQIEVAVAENHTALVFRHLVPLTDSDIKLLQEFSVENNLQIFLQSAGPDSIKPVINDQYQPLKYSLADYNIDLFFTPLDFTQVNFDINNKMISLALELLSINDKDHVLDLFCGLGNFSMPMANSAARVTAVEGDKNLVARANYNAQKNRIKNVSFHVADLAGEKIDTSFINQAYDKILLDPPRSGAQDIIRQLDFGSTKKIVYISCNPATLARDAGTLVNERGFKLVKAGIMDMFPHTTHVESIALFEKLN